MFIFCSEAEHEPKSTSCPLKDCPKSLKKLFVAGGGLLDSEILRKEGNLQTFRAGRWIHVERKIEVEDRDSSKLYSKERRLFLAFLQADPVEVFQRLFVDKGIGPMFVCLHWTQWESRFRDLLLEAGTARPKYLVGKWPRIYTPWTLLWQKYRSWSDTAVFQQRDAPLLPFQEVVPYANLHWVNTPLNPDNVDEADAVHLTTEQYLAHPWPDHIQKIFVDVSDKKVPAELRANDPRLSPLRLSGLPIQEALPKLTEACSKAGINNIHAGRFGFEDESDVLRDIWPTKYPWNLTIHCETVDEIRSLQGFHCNDLRPPATAIGGG